MGFQMQLDFAIFHGVLIIVVKVGFLIGLDLEAIQVLQSSGLGAQPLQTLLSIVARPIRFLLNCMPSGLQSLARASSHSPLSFGLG